MLGEPKWSTPGSGAAHTVLVAASEDLDFLDAPDDATDENRPTESRDVATVNADAVDSPTPHLRDDPLSVCSRPSVSFGASPGPLRLRCPSCDCSDRSCSLRSESCACCLARTSAVCVSTSLRPLSVLARMTSRPVVPLKEARRVEMPRETRPSPTSTALASAPKVSIDRRAPAPGAGAPDPRAVASGLYRRRFADDS